MSSNATSSPIAVETLGTPRIGPRRELKLALESFWSGAADEKALRATAAALRAANWARQKKLGVTILPSNDFSLYDQVLDTSVMVGAIPDIYGWKGGEVSLSTYFAMARGAQADGHAVSCGHAHHGSAHGAPALEMTKWFDTNYHYMVPELRRGYAMFADALPALKIMLASYFGGLGDNLNTAMSLPISGLHIDLVRAPNQLDDVLKKAPKGLVLSLGVIDGRNIWRANLPDILDRLEPVAAKRGADQIQIAPSCSLLHVPIDLEQETDLDPELKAWLAFSVQKMDELATLGAALARGRDAVKDALAASMAAAAARRASPKV